MTLGQRRRQAPARRTSQRARACGDRSGAGTSATRCRGTARGSTGSSMRREAFVRWPVHGNVLEALRQGRLELGAGVLFEPGVWITAPGSARVRIGAGTFLNMGVMVAAEELVEIGDHCMLANGCFVSDLATATTTPIGRSPGRAFRARAHAHRRQLLARRPRRRHQRCHDRRALCDRREQRRHS